MAATGTFPSSHGSLEEDHGPGLFDGVAPDQDPGGGGSPTFEDEFDSDEFRSFLRHRQERRRSERDRGGRGRRGAHRDHDSGDDGGGESRSGGNINPPEWNGLSPSFQDWLIKARLWIATTKAKPKSQGPLILQRLSGQPFQSFKHWARDAAWLQDDRGGHRLLDAMNSPEHFGEDREEELLSALSRVTYHMKRGREENIRGFLARWEDALRKVGEHHVDLPDKYIGFLLINSLGLGDGDIKSLLTYTHGSILPKDIKEWARKHEMKLQAKDIGLDKDRKNQSKSYAANYVANEDYEDDELKAIEEAIYELQEDPEDDGYPTGGGAEAYEDEILEEHEAAEILNTMVQHHKKKTFMQSVKTKKAKELARGFGNWRRNDAGGKGSGKTVMSATGRIGGGQYRMSLEELKKNSRCSRCNQVGHWHKDPQCPKNQKTKESHLLETAEMDETEDAIFCGFLYGEEGDEKQINEPNRQGHGDRALHGEGYELHAGEDHMSDSTSDQVAVHLYDRMSGDIGQPSNTEGFEQGHVNLSEAYNDRCNDSLEGSPDVFKKHRTRRHEILWEDCVSQGSTKLDPNDDLCGTIDTGCQRMAIGKVTLRRFQEALNPKMHIGLMKQEYKFRSVHGKSSTSHVATIPTSLGRNGSILKPAIFTGENSENAPFLISLPFLMNCQTVLHLDPRQGLRAHFKRFGFSVPCHLGPTGALRIPLGSFSDQQLGKLQQAQNELIRTREEFEIYKTAEIFASGSDPDTGETTTQSEPFDCERHGGRWSQQTSTFNSGIMEDAGGRVDKVGDQGDLRDGESFGATTQVDGCAGNYAQPREWKGTVQRVADNATNEHPVRDGRRERGRDSSDGQFPIGESNKSAWNTKEKHSPRSTTESEPIDIVYEHQRRELPDRGRPGQDGTSANVSASPTVHAVDDPERGKQLPEDVLEMPGEPGISMRDVHLDPISTTMDSAGILCTENPNAIGTRAQDEHESTSARAVQALEDYTIGNQRLRGEGEVLGLRHAIGESSQDGGQDQRKSCQFKANKSEIQLLHGDGGREPPHVGYRDGGVQDVPGIPQVEEGPSGSRTELRGSMRAEAEEIYGEIYGDATNKPWSKRIDKVVRQSKEALQKAEHAWMEIMSLLSTEPESAERVGLDRLQTSLGNSDDGRKANRRTLGCMATVLHVSEKQAKRVAEVYNPNRFKKEVKRNRLIHDQAFDLELGYDLLDAETRQEVKEHVRTVKPGLVVISPPCTLFTLLQNLSQKLREANPELLKEHLRKLRRAKVLLRFGVEMAKEVLEYGGIFLFEHPVTSRAWQERELLQLLEKDEVKLAKCDQCMYGLRSTSGKYHRKATGWCTNSTRLADALSQTCDGSHQHEPVIGREPGSRESRSRESQRYPGDLVRTIIKAYKEEIQDELLYVKVVKRDQLHRDRQRQQRIQAEINYVMEMKPETEGHEVFVNDEVPEDDEVFDEIAAPAINGGEVPRDDREGGPEEEADRPRQWLPRERPFSTKQLVKRAHDGLGHPGNDKLVRILRHAKASEEAIREARHLRCPVCERHAKIHAPRNAAPPKEWHMNQVVGVDSVWLPTQTGKNRLALNIVCWASRFQMMIPLEDHTPGSARRAYLQWLKLFGPPERVYVDLGKEFKGAFELGAEVDSTYYEPGSLEMPTQRIRSITERAGKSYKEVLSKAMEQYDCHGEEDWLELVDIVSMTMNRLVNKSGYSPIQRVLGYTPRIPGGLFSGGANDLPILNRLQGGDLQVQKAQEMRLAAAKAFYDADAKQCLRNAVHAGYRPQREFEAGQLVYFWRKGADHAKKDRPFYWRGPARVILTAPPSSIWLSYRGTIVKAAPEHLRHANTEEQFTLSQWIDDIVKTREEVDQTPNKGYIDLSDEPFPVDEENQPGQIENKFDEVLPQRRLKRKSMVSEIPRRDKEEDEWHYLPDRGVLRRVHHQTRTQRFNPEESGWDCPVDFKRIKEFRKTMMHRGDGSIYTLIDDWTQSIEQEHFEPWTGYTEFQVEMDVVQPMSVERGAPSRPHSEFVEPEKINEEPPNDQPVEEEKQEERMIDIEDSVRVERGTVRERDEPEESEENEQERDAKRLRTEFLEILNVAIEKALAAKQKKEITYRKLPESEKGKFQTAIEKEINNNIESGAYIILDKEASERIRREKDDKIVKSRYVLTEKPIEEDDIPKAQCEGVLMVKDGNNSTKAKARHVMKGFSEENSEYLEVTTPQVNKESVMFSLQMMASRQWKPGYLDFTQAFHSGDRLEREIYAEQPMEGIPGCHPRQLLELRKCCYGLLDGPYQWFQHLRRILVENLGYQASKSDPCLYFLFGKNQELCGIISVATDDLLHGGDRRHWEKMQWLNKNYRLGKFTEGNGRFTGKEIEVQEDGSILVHQKLYAETRIKEIPIERGRKGRKMSRCTAEEITQLRGLLGGLAWLSKETRPDIAGRTAFLQQSMPEPMVADLLEANALAREVLSTSGVGIKIQPIELDRLRVGTITDASWGNVKPETREEDEEDEDGDFWIEEATRWRRVHRRPRRLLFHPGSTKDGPDLYDITEERYTTWEEDEERKDAWNHKDSQRALREEPWTGETVFFKVKEDEKNMKKKGTINERYLQNERLSSQGGYLTFFYDQRMETEEKPYPISMVNWKSYKVRRCTVNTLSAECQAMVQGVGTLHWVRALLQESKGVELLPGRWEEQVAETPFIAVTDSKSLYDTITKLRTTASHIEDKRTAIDVTILKNDVQKTKGQVRWVEGCRMLADSLTKKMSSVYLRSVLKTGTWSLTERGFEMQEQASKGVSKEALIR